MSDGSLPFRVLNEIGIIAQLAQTAFEHVMPAGMTLPQFTVLNHFARLGGTRSPAELAAAFQVTRATMTSTLQRLQAKGFVDVTPDERDRRGKRVAITPAGAAMRDACLSALKPEIERLALDDLADDMQAYLPALTRLRQLLDKKRRGIRVAKGRPEGEAL